jgi:hypothetical protein
MMKYNIMKIKPVIQFVQFVWNWKCHIGEVNDRKIPKHKYPFRVKQKWKKKALNCNEKFLIGIFIYKEITDVSKSYIDT